jgi:UDP-N-acetylmuramate dehydrogenase
VAWEPERNVPLAPLTTWRIGGPAECFGEPESENELRDALEWAAREGVPVRVLGRGSNVLIADAGLSGLVLSLRSFDKERTDLQEPATGPVRLEVSAGMFLPKLAKAVAQLGFTGYEFYIGIPGTVGGALVMNAGFGPGDERQTAHRCTEVRVMDPAGQTRWLSYAELNPVYRHTDLLESGLIVTAGRFKLAERSTREAIRAVTAEHLAMRKSRQPLTRPTAGSVFKGTPEGVPAAVYIDRCGLKGTRIGDAIVSPKHANWIENLGHARAADVMELINLVRETVKSKDGIELETEVRLLK